MFREVCQMQENAQPCVLVTVVDKTGEGPQIVGSKMLVCPDGTARGTIGGGALESLARERAVDVFAAKKCELVRYDLGMEKIQTDDQQTGMICGGTLTLFFDFIPASPAVYIFGAGHVGRAVVRHLKNLDYLATVVDHRDGIFAGFEDDARTIRGDYTDVIGKFRVSSPAYVVIATVGHAYDYEVLKNIYLNNWNPAYIGLLSSKNKVREIIQRLRLEVNSPDLGCLYTPAGLAIGGATPDEIAISIIAEMQSVRYRKKGQANMREEWYI